MFSFLKRSSPAGVEAARTESTRVMGASRVVRPGVAGVRASGAEGAETPEAVEGLPEHMKNLGPAARRRMLTLPGSIAPRLTCTRYPVVAERLLMQWDQPEAFRATLSTLILNARGAREGFPFEIVRELVDLSEYYDQNVRPAARNVWDRAHRI